MDNLTHSFVGLAAAKAGLERVSPYATAVCLLAANLPDSDLVTVLAGRWVYLHQHRGVSHSIIGTFVLSVALPLAVWAVDRLVARMRGRPPRARLRGLLLASLAVGASHPLLDWTNSYGLRPLLPWDARWLYGDLVFIIDPWLWLSLGGAAFLLTATTKRRVLAWSVLAALLTAGVLLVPERGWTTYPLTARLLWLAGVGGLFVAYRARLGERLGSSIAVAALALVVAYWGALAVLHARAFDLARARAGELAAGRGERLERVAAMPTLAHPLRWYAIAETGGALLRYEVRLAGGGADGPRVSVIEKPRGAEAEAVRLASRDERARVLLNFARFPAARVERGCAAETLVRFADLRFAAPGESRGSFTLDVPLPPSPR